MYSIRKAIRAALRVWDVLCFSNAFWLDQELRTIVKQADRLDTLAIADAAYLVPKEESVSLFNRSFEEGLGTLPTKKRVNLAIRFVQASLEMRHQRVFNGLWTVAPTFPGNVGPFHNTLYELRDSLWNCLPDRWQFRDETLARMVTSSTLGETIEDSELVMPVLYLMYRSTLSAKFNMDESQDTEFLEKMSWLFTTFQRKLTAEILMQKPNIRYPVSMLLSICIQRKTFEHEGKCFLS